MIPTVIDEVERRIRQLEIERQVLSHEKDEASIERLTKLDEELSNLKEKHHGMKAHWQMEKDTIEKIGKLNEELEKTKIEEERLERIGEFNKVAELRYGRIPDLTRQIQEEKAGVLPKSRRIRNSSRKKSKKTTLPRSFQGGRGFR